MEIASASHGDLGHLCRAGNVKGRAEVPVLVEGFHSPAGKAPRALAFPFPCSPKNPDGISKIRRESSSILQAFHLEETRYTEGEGRIITPRATVTSPELEQVTET